MTYTIEKVTTLIGARRFGEHVARIGFILADSRSLCFPEETLFFALRSERNDGHHYIPELYRRGVRNFVVTEVGNDYLRYTENVPQFVLRNLNEGIDAYFTAVREQFGDRVVPQQNTGTSLDINPPGVNKAVGVQALADAMGLSLDEVMVAGDADNDFEMLAMGAFSVVPENGLPEAKERASYVTASNDANGIALAIEKFVL